jgi:hypothetical protein
MHENLPATSISPIFLVGCPRSGTTLLQQMLDAHPDVAIAPEIHFVRRFWQNRDAYGSLDSSDQFRRLLTDIMAIPEFAEMELDADRFSEAAWQSDRTYAALFQLLLQQFAHRRGVNVFGEKTPNNVLHMETLQTFFPSARFIHLVRDPRDVVNSWRSVPWSTGSIAGDAEIWEYYVSSARNCSDSVQAALLTVHYEQLVVSPEETLRSLCEFVGIEFTPAMLAYHQRKSQGVNVSREPWKANAVNPLSQGSIARWQRELTPEMISAIEAVTWFEMRHFGYKPQTQPMQLLPSTAFFATRREFKRFSGRISYHFKRVSKGG